MLYVLPAQTLPSSIRSRDLGHATSPFNTWSHMVLAEALRFLLHNLTINLRSSAYPNKELSLGCVLQVSSMAENFLDQLLQDPNNIRPNGDCVICMEETGKPNRETGCVELQLRLPCSHVAGSDCLRTWLREHNSCPICRREVFPTQRRVLHGMWPDGESESESESDSDSESDDDFDEEQRSDDDEGSDEDQNHAESDAAFGNIRGQDRENLEEAMSEDAPAGVLEQDLEINEEALPGLVRDDVPDEQFQESLEEGVSDDARDVLEQDQELLDKDTFDDVLDDALGQNEEMHDAVVSDTPEIAGDLNLHIDEEDKLGFAEDQDLDRGEEDELDIAEDEDLSGGEEDELDIAEDEDLSSDEEDELDIAEDEDMDIGEEDELDIAEDEDLDSGEEDMDSGEEETIQEEDQSVDDE